MHTALIIFSGCVLGALMAKVMFSRVEIEPADLFAFILAILVALQEFGIA